MNNTRVAPVLMILRMIASAFMIVPVFIALALFFVFVPINGVGRPGPVLVVPVILGVLVYLLQNLVGFRAPAIPVGAPRQSYLPGFQSGVFLRLALAEAVMLVSLALAFVVTDVGYLVFLVGGVITEILLLVNAWPSERVIEKYRRVLEREGGQSYLREDLGLSTPGLPTSF